MTEVLPASQSLFPVPPVNAQISWIDWLKSRTPDDSVIACVPFPKGTRVEDYEETALGMYWGTYHHRRLVNGYSGFFPPSFLDTKTVMRSFPDHASAQRLRELGVTCCVIRREALPREAAMEKWFELLFSDDTAQVDIYRISQIRQNQAP